ncbi:MAG: 23S rRNA (pseudouridine(1915)-N(3))-methyltransferase RlmH [Helicobacteraceae bacterium]|nr:23S rRNA (pseudouridine(1915)-N(3))-methyltransferase RlmH [Helicobacteraceae bacterium]
MTAIELKYIGKRDDKLFSQARAHYAKLIAPYAKLTVSPVWNAAIEKAQKIGAIQAQEAYSQAFFALRSRAAQRSIAVDALGKTYDTNAFAELIANGESLCFYIGGAYGFAREFCKTCDLSVSLSALTFSRDLAQIVLLEQIYRALTIGANHPYGK